MKTVHASAEKMGERQRARSGWLAVTGLLLLGALPVFGGLLRLRDLGAVPESGLLLASPAAVVAHIVATSVYCILGAFQFSPALRIRRGWHRTAGRALIPAGITSGLSAVWLAVFFGGPSDERALAMARLVFAVAMTVFLVLGALAIKRRDFVGHGAWMTRAFAIAISGGTQALLVVLWALPFGEVDIVGETWLVAVGFVVNSAVAELLIRRSRRGSVAPNWDRGGRAGGG